MPHVGFVLENHPLEQIRDGGILAFSGVKPPSDRKLIYHLPPAAYVFSHQRRVHYSDPALVLRRTADFPAEESLRWKDRFAAFVSTACTMQHYRGLYQMPKTVDDVPLVRTLFVDQLTSKYKKVDGLGHCRKTANPPAFSPWTTRALLSEQTITWFGKYKFAICFENSAGPGWISEKLFDAYMGVSIPVYWGPTDLEQYGLNGDAFVLCNPDGYSPPTTGNRQVYMLPNATFNACIEEIRRLDHDDAAYARKLRQPLLKDNVVPPWLTYEPYARWLLSKWMPEVQIPS